MCKVVFSRFAEKQIRKLPEQILKALRVWMRSVEVDGVMEMRKMPGYRDEALKGDRKGQRSSRLSRSYRVIYVETADGSVTVFRVLEVNKHDY
ncbi:MAG: hypothetical protein EBX52_07210 [Proteobacteria bacterium]|nr:hypothetical protein [Pseudomonadota bacterium]